MFERVALDFIKEDPTSYWLRVNCHAGTDALSDKWEQPLYVVEILLGHRETSLVPDEWVGSIWCHKVRNGGTW